MFSIDIVIDICCQSTMTASVAIHPGAINSLLNAQIQQKASLFEVLPFQCSNGTECP